MKREVRKKIQEIMRDMQCLKNFKCAESGFKKLCEAKDIGVEDFLQCLESDSVRDIYFNVHCGYISKRN